MALGEKAEDADLDCAAAVPAKIASKRINFARGGETILF